MNITAQGQILKNMYAKAFLDIRKKYDLTINEVMLLFYLYKFKNKDTAKDISDCTLCTKSHISKSVENLANRNLINRIPDIKDKKCIHLKLKENGLKIAKEINEKNDEIDLKITENIDKEDLEITRDTIKKIVKNISIYIK